MATATQQHESANAGSLIVRPQTSIGMVAEQQRAVAEIQAALTVAAARPRDEKRALERIEIACQRPGLAEKAEYAYSRGGQEITGPTIDLLTVIANCWGNIQFGFRELSQRNGESEVEAFAWDLETNSKRSVTFTVPHKRFTRSGSTNLTDPRDIYELVANQAQRRVRACLEAVIPPDVVEDGVMQCRATLKESAEVNTESIKRLIDAFEKIGVTKQQIETRLGRRIDTMQPAQLVSMRRIYKSISDGMSQTGDWFQPTEEQEKKAESPTSTVKDALKKNASKKPPKEEPETTSESAGESTGSARWDEWKQQFLATTTEAEVDALLKTTQPWDTQDDEETALMYANEAKARIKKK